MTVLTGGEDLAATTAPPREGSFAAPGKPALWGFPVSRQGHPPERHIGPLHPPDCRSQQAPHNLQAL
jgi:hypothetical protein